MIMEYNIVLLAIYGLPTVDKSFIMKINIAKRLRNLKNEKVTHTLLVNV